MAAAVDGVANHLLAGSAVLMHVLAHGGSIGGAVGLAMIETGEPVTPDVINSGTWEVDVAGVRYPAVASLRPMYDPDNARIKA